MKRRHQGCLQEISMATSLRPGCMIIASDACFEREAARWRVAQNGCMVFRQVPGQRSLEAGCDIAGELSLATGGKTATSGCFMQGTMLRSGHFSSRMLGRDASHRTRKLDTHLTHGCMQHFRHFLSGGSDATSKSRDETSGFLPFLEPLICRWSRAVR